MDAECIYQKRIKNEGIKITICKSIIKQTTNIETVINKFVMTLDVIFF